MKLLLVASMLAGFAGLAHADTYSGPPGGDADVVYQPVAQPAQHRGTNEVRRAVLDRFDRNHDGRLEPRERAQAARALRRMANRMEQRDRRQLRAQRQQLRAERRAQRQGGQQAPNVDVYVE